MDLFFFSKNILQWVMKRSGKTNSTAKFSFFHGKTNDETKKLDRIKKMWLLWTDLRFRNRYSW